MFLELVMHPKNVVLHMELKSVFQKGWVEFIISVISKGNAGYDNKGWYRFERCVFYAISLSILHNCIPAKKSF